MTDNVANSLSAEEFKRAESYGISEGLLALAKSDGFTLDEMIKLTQLQMHSKKENEYTFEFAV